MKYHFVEICINSYDIKRLLKFNELEYREIKISNNEATFLINKKYLARLTEKCEKYNIEIKNVSEIGNINKMGELFVELSHGRSGGTWLEVGMELRQAATGSLLKISRKF